MCLRYAVTGHITDKGKVFDIITAPGTVENSKPALVYDILPLEELVPESRQVWSLTLAVTKQSRRFSSCVIGCCL